MGTILIRTDANVPMGTGHVMRCLALAQSWKDTGGDAIFAMAESTPGLNERLQSEGFEMVAIDKAPGSGDDAARTSEIARSNNAAWLVVDGYQFGSDYQREIKNAQLRLLWMDDNGEASPYTADLVLNQNIHAAESLYGLRSPITCLLLGTRYALLRGEFTRWKDWTREIPTCAQKILVTMGGSDPQNWTGQVLDALDGFQGIEIVVIVGGSNPHAAELEQLISRFQGRVRLEHNVQNIAEWMAWADVAIAAAGSTSWEMCLLGLPSIIMDVAPNQSALAHELDRRGAAVYFNPRDAGFARRLLAELQSLIASAEKRTILSLAGRKLVDGRGASRVVAAMRGATLSLRRVNPEDCHLLWQWANDPEVRQASFRSEPIPWERHRHWFEKKLQDPNCFFYVGVDENHCPVGQVRFDYLHEDEFEIGISVAPDRRGAGFGVELMRKAAETMLRENPHSSLHAFIKPENEASIRLFGNAGFRKLPAASEKYGAVHFIYNPGESGNDD